MFRVLGGPESRRLLVVDDNEMNLEVAAAMLKMLGYEADLAHDGVEAVEKAEQRNYAALFVDVQMPRMDGLEATRRIRRIPRHATTPIVAMTASAFDEDRKQCLEAGMNDLVSKPVAPALLAKVLSRWAPTASPAQTGPTTATATAFRASAHDTVQGASREHLLQLQRLVAADDMTAREFFHALPAEDVARFGSALGTSLDDFDYEKAGRLISGLLDQPGTEAARP
jgi:CheY-like chemotaxis protein